MSPDSCSLTAYDELKMRLAARPRTWLVSGVAGFIGSNLLETLLALGQRVIGLDNFATGHRRNLDEVRVLVGPQRWRNFSFIEGDVRNLADCRAACEGVTHVLHQAALGSVPRSLADPVGTHSVNITGFLHMLEAARQAGVRTFVYAVSSSVYGDHPALPKVEHAIGKPLSPYALTKYVNELYAEVFGRCYGLHTVGLRYFNVFGERQDPEGAYAAVIPKWTAALTRGEPVFINGDGETSRDFCYVANAVQANLLAASTEDPRALDQVYNVAVSGRTTLNALFGLLCRQLAAHGVRAEGQPVYRDFREGDVRHSQADISKARQLLGYGPTHDIGQGISAAMAWYVDQLTRAG